MKERIGLMVRGLVSSGYFEHADPETTRRVIMTNIVGLFAIIMLIPLGFSSRREGNSVLVPLSQADVHHSEAGVAIRAELDSGEEG